MNSNRVAAAAVAAIAVALFGATFWFDKMPEGITRGFGADPDRILRHAFTLARSRKRQNGGKYRYD